MVPSCHLRKLTLRKNFKDFDQFGPAYEYIINKGMC